MIARIYRFSRFGFVLGALNLFISVSWIAIAYGNPWHQGILAIMDFPACYFAIGFTWLLGALVPKDDLVVNIASEVAFVVVGVLWFFLVGFIIQRFVRRIKYRKSA